MELSKYITKQKLAYLPIIILTLMTMYTEYVFATTDYAHSWKNILWLVFISINYILFYINHKVGISGMAITLLIGLIGLISFEPVDMMASFNLIFHNGATVPLFYGKPIFILLIILQIATSGQHFYGILSAKHWQEIKRLFIEGIKSKMK